MKAIIYNARPEAKRIKFYIPYKNYDFRKKIKALNSSFWHPNQKLWSIINTEKNLDLLKEIFGTDYIIELGEIPNQVKRIQLS